MKVTEVLRRDEIRALLVLSDIAGIRSLARTWGLIALAFAGAALWPHPIVWAVAIVVVGGRQLALAVLVHECAHRSLFRTRWLNDVAGRWLCGAPIWADLGRYRIHHLAHHRNTNTDADPDIGLVLPFPTSLAGVRRKLQRDLLGWAGLRRAFGLFLMDLGLLTYTASTGARRCPFDPHRALRGFIVYTGPVLLTNGATLAVLWAFGHAWLYALWVFAWLTTYGAFLRIRAWAEHACTARVEDPFHNTRTTRAGLLARLTCAPHQVNYHLEHHLLMTVPHYRLPAMHALLRARGVFGPHNYANGYFNIIRTIASEK